MRLFVVSRGAVGVSKVCLGAAGSAGGFQEVAHMAEQEPTVMGGTVGISRGYNNGQQGCTCGRQWSS